MTKVFKLHKGLDILLKGKADKVRKQIPFSGEVALSPDSFPGIVPKVLVREGQQVKAGDALFVNKQHPEIGFSSPVSGTVTAIVRGQRRKVLNVIVKPDAKQQSVDFGKKVVAEMSSQQVIDTLSKAGLFGYINQLPYAVSTNADVLPKGIFISALRDMPLAADFEYELQGNENDFQTGLTALSKIAKTYLGIGREQSSQCLRQAKDVEVNIFEGKCPAGNVGVQVNHIAPVCKGELVWTVDPSAVIFFGRLFNTGKVDLHRTIAIVGSEVKTPVYADVIVGQKISTLLDGNLTHSDGIRIINGNVLTGNKANMDDFLDAHASEITVIPEGDHANEMFGWIMPRLNEFSVSRSYLSWLMKGKEYVLDSRIKGGERHMIMSGEYDRVFPMDIYPEYLIKAIITEDIDKMEALGIYEVAPEDFALAEFVDSSKLELQSIVRKGLDMLRKENA
ncbi:MAG: Na(+)-translocating NADH-quinone reductase subunit A [Prevotella sp.]|nr:Na(+)-translocating NADH-quinone reductase subunit A [Prevotella sp.]